MAADDYITVNVQGLDNLQKKLEELPEKLAKKDLRAAARAGANVIKKATMALIPVETGFEQSHIDVRTRMRSDSLAITAWIGPNSKIVRPERIGKENRKGKPWRQWPASMVARFMEFGTSRHAKHPVFTQGFETSKEKAVEAVVEKLKSSLGL